MQAFAAVVTSARSCRRSSFERGPSGRVRFASLRQPCCSVESAFHQAWIFARRSPVGTVMPQPSAAARRSARTFVRSSGVRGPIGRLMLALSRHAFSPAVSRENQRQPRTGGVGVVSAATSLTAPTVVAASAVAGAKVVTPDQTEPAEGRRREGRRENAHVRAFLSVAARCGRPRDPICWADLAAPAGEPRDFLGIRGSSLRPRRTRATLWRMTPATPARVLVVDDEENISYLVASALRLAGHEVASAASGAAAVEEANAFAPDVVVLDVMLPDFDGFEVMRRLRVSGSRAAIVFLSARSDTADRVRGLTTGGEDYVVKPFAVEELVARVGLALRRSGAATGASARMQVGDLVLDDDAHRVWRGDREAHLTATEFTLLRCLMSSAGRVVTRAQILDHVWQYDFSGESAIVDSFVSTLRKKVDPGTVDEPRLIHTVRGVGYTIREPGSR